MGLTTPRVHRESRDARGLGDLLHGPAGFRKLAFEFAPEHLLLFDVACLRGLIRYLSGKAANLTAERGDHAVTLGMAPLLRAP